MLAFVRDGNTVLVHSIDRLARNLDDLRALVRTMTGRGVVIQEHVDAIELPAWPVYGLANGGKHGWLSGGGESSDSGLNELRLSYCPPGEAERLTVHTQRRGTSAVDLGRLLS